MSNDPIDLLQDLAKAVTEGERQDIVFLNPHLLSPQVQQALFEKVATLTPAEKARLQPHLDYLEKIQHIFEAQPELYPIGSGPIEQLWLKQTRGEITSAYAKTLAQKPEFIASLSPVYIQALSRFDMLSTYRGGWQQALKMHELLLVVVDVSANAQEIFALQQQVYSDWIEIVQCALVHIADGRLYRRARAAGDKLVEQAKTARNRQFLGEILHRLGTLHLDPYTAGRRNTNYQNDIYRWQQQFLTEFGQEVAGLPKDEWSMPAPEEALSLAEQYLHQAVDVRLGQAKGLSLKALIQTLEWLEVLNQPINQPELIDLCHQALELLEPDQYPEHRLAILATLSRKNQPVDPTEVERTLATSLDEYIRRWGAPRTMDLVMQAISVLRKDAPLRSLELSHRAGSLFQRYGDEKYQVNNWQNQLNLIMQALAPAPVSQLPQGGLPAVVQQLRKQAQAEQWDIRTMSAALIALSANSGKWNEENIGLALLDEAQRMAPLFYDDYANALAFLRSTLLLGIGVNEVNTSNWGPAVEAYSKALQQYLDLDLVDASTDCLRRVNDLATRYGPNVALQVILGLAPLALRLETRLGEPATQLLQHICKSTVAAMMDQAVNTEELVFVLQVAKGLRFATALYAGSRYKWQEDELALRLLEKIREAEAALPPDSPLIAPLDPEALLDKDTILTAYTRPAERQAGDEPSERLVNLQHSYDAHLNERLLTATPNQETLYLSTQDIRVALDRRTVLLNFYLGASVDGRIAVYLLVLTREDVQGSFVVHEFPDSLVLMGDGERELQMSPFAVTVQSLRRNLVAEPGPHLVDRDAGKGLETDMRGYLGHLVEYLDRMLASGKDHLCIIPHGPLHYYPFHLLGQVGKPLADQWIVTYLPNLHLLISRRGQPAVRRHRERSLTAIGLSFQNTTLPGLPPIPQSINEARSIANIFETEALLDEKATKQAVFEAFNQSRYVHLSTHGWHNVNAPAFQCLYLTPDGESDGRLYAHELLSLDLRGLDLLTLSACETALGRFDNGDNLRGLPASFLLSGVSTIVGTLWPVEANASEYFFTALYSQIKAGTSHLDAFATAQRETRVAFPKYRDWGSFYLMGDWL